MKLTPEEEQQLLAAFRGEPTDTNVSDEPPTLQPNTWVEAPIIDGQANTPTQKPQAEIDREHNITEFFKGNRD